RHPLPLRRGRTMSGMWLKQTFRGIPSARWHETSAGSPEVSALMRGSLPRPSGEGLEVGHFKWRQAFLPVLSCFRDEFDRQECLSLHRWSLPSHPSLCDGLGDWVAETGLERPAYPQMPLRGNENVQTLGTWLKPGATPSRTRLAAAS